MRAALSAGNGHLFTHVVAVLGSPTRPPRYTPSHLAALREVGFNTVQLNVAWLSRPHDEPLNLRDVVPGPGEPETDAVRARFEELRRRCDLTKRAGLHTLFHVGSPFMWRDPETGAVVNPGNRLRSYDLAESGLGTGFDVLDPRVLEYEVGLVRELRRRCPGIDDLLVYTYDQDAWQVSEFGQSQRSRGVPLHQRLPSYLAALHQAWTEGRPDAILWWEPWELSAGQVYACLPRVPASGFGLCLHANIAEVQLARPVDPWLRNTARLAAARGMPVTVEGFLGSMNEEIEPLALPSPRLVDEQVRAIAGVDGVTGIKEYYGVDAQALDLNLEVFSRRLRDMTAPTSALIAAVTRRFTDPQRLASALAAIDDALQILPWDASWFFRRLGTVGARHGWGAATVRGQICTTPSWESTRRAHFMMTDDTQPHAYLMEDVQLRCEAAADLLDQATTLVHGIRASGVGEAPPAGASVGANPRAAAEAAEAEMLAGIAEAAWRVARVVKGYALHLRETLVAGMLREDLEGGRPLTPHLRAELLDLLRRDLDNQDGEQEVRAALELATADLPGFLDRYLRPGTEGRLECGLHAVTTR